GREDGDHPAGALRLRLPRLQRLRGPRASPGGRIVWGAQHNPGRPSSQVAGRRVPMGLTGCLLAEAPHAPRPRWHLWLVVQGMVGRLLPSGTHETRVSACRPRVRPGAEGSLADRLGSRTSCRTLSDRGVTTNNSSCLLKTVGVELQSATVL